MGARRPVGVRWTIGDVSDAGYEALRLSIWGAHRIFGDGGRYAVCVNSVPLRDAVCRTGDLPPGVEWHESDARVPDFIARAVDRHMAEGVCWKFAPLRLFPDRWELSLDNDCILWAMPRAVREWLEGDDPVALVSAEDVRPMFGQFAHLAGDAPGNSGIRGLPPGFDLEGWLRRMLADNPVTLTSELDEQGLQVAMLRRAGPPLMVTIDEVTICSPFPPHRRELGLCGAHFVGLNARELPWEHDGRPAAELTRAHWRHHREAIAARVGVPVACPARPARARTRAS